MEVEVEVVAGARPPTLALLPLTSSLSSTLALLAAGGLLEPAAPVAAGGGASPFALALGVLVELAARSGVVPLRLAPKALFAST